MSEPTDAQVEAAAWINEVRRQNGLMPIKTVPKRDRDDWLPRARAALMAARQSIQDGTALVRQFNEWTPPNTLQSQLSDIAPYYSPVATAQARIKELEAALGRLVGEVTPAAEALRLGKNDPLMVAARQARAALSKGKQGAT